MNLSSTTSVDRFWMRVAILLAHDAVVLGMRPFGCVIVDHRNGLVAIGNGSETETNPTCHSEMVAIQRACETRQGLLEGCTLISTHEPCGMCCGAICHAKISEVVWGSERGDLPQLFRRQNYSAYDLLTNTSNPPTRLGGVMRAECIALFDQEVALFDPGWVR